MSNSILYCSKCKKFTMEETCSCGSKTVTTKPAKFSLEDKWGAYRRQFKEQHKTL